MSPSSRSSILTRERLQQISSVLAGATVLVCLAVSSHWIIQVLVHRKRVGIQAFGGVGDLDQLKVGHWALGVVAALIAIFVVLLRKHRGLAGRRLASAGVGLSMLGLAAPFVSTHGHFLLIGLAALIVAAAALVLPELRSQGGRPVRSDRGVALVLWAIAALIGCVFAMYRFWAFGAGSWDMGCMVHNFYRASHFADTISTVLGGADFLGDHFMIGIYLYSPLFWLDSSGYMVILVQTVNLTAAAPAVYLIARRHEAERIPAIALGLAAGFAFGIQSAVYFDAHGITVGFAFLAFALYALEARRLVMASVLIAIFALFKESIGAYVIGLGLLLSWRGIRDADRRTLRFGLAWMLGGAIWFVLVNRFFIPPLIARGVPPEPHETFADFGPTVFSALVGIVSHPLKAAAALFVPEAKVSSLLVTLGGVGGLSLFAPEILLAALPLLAERFLSSKLTMWEMGYHYAAPLCLYAAWAAAVGWPRVRARVARGLDGLERGLGRRSATFLAVYVLASAVLINSVGYRHPVVYHSLQKDYFAPLTQRADWAEAVRLVQAQGRDAKVAAQNRLLPHLADRLEIYRLGQWEKADWVVLALGHNAWPYDAGMPRRIAVQLRRSPDWRLVYARGTVLVFARQGATELPAVAPDPMQRLPGPSASGDHGSSGAAGSGTVVDPPQGHR